eukprot:scaffold300089_cov28-Tisochrysis_lutea.AAC.3
MPNWLENLRDQRPAQLITASASRGSAPPSASSTSKPPPVRGRTASTSAPKRNSAPASRARRATAVVSIVGSTSPSAGV